MKTLIAPSFGHAGDFCFLGKHDRTVNKQRDGVQNSVVFDERQYDHYDYDASMKQIREVSATNNGSYKPTNENFVIFRKQCLL